MKKFTGIFVAFCLLTVFLLGLTACTDTAEYSVICQNSDNGSVMVQNTRVHSGEKVILAARPNTGYKLVSFTVDGNVLDGCSFVMPDRDVTVSATFDVVTYSVTYVLGDAVILQDNPSAYTVDSAAVLHNPQKEGYEICGWYRYCTEPENSYDWDIEYYRVTSLEGLLGDVTLYAKYYNPTHTIDVENVENGWFYVEDYDCDESYYGKTYNVVVDPDTGYELDYLIVNGNSLEKGVTSFTVPMSDVVLTAVFKPIVYDITYVLFGGDNAEDNPATFTVEDGYVYLSDPTKDGYMFCGWFTDEDMNSQPVYDGFYAYDYTESSLTLYAKFEPDEEY